jgi:hypothetical protein
MIFIVLSSCHSSYVEIVVTSSSDYSQLLQQVYTRKATGKDLTKSGKTVELRHAKGSYFHHGDIIRFAQAEWDIGRGVNE